MTQPGNAWARLPIIHRRSGKGSRGLLAGFGVEPQALMPRHIPERERTAAQRLGGARRHNMAGICQRPVCENQGKEPSRSHAFTSDIGGQAKRATPAGTKETPRARANSTGGIPFDRHKTKPPQPYILCVGAMELSVKTAFFWTAEEPSRHCEV